MFFFVFFVVIFVLFLFLLFSELLASSTNHRTSVDPLQYMHTHEHAPTHKHIHNPHLLCICEERNVAVSFSLSLFVSLFSACLFADAYMNRVAKKQSTIANGSFSSKQSSQAGSDDDEPSDAGLVMLSRILSRFSMITMSVPLVVVFAVSATAEADGTASADAAEEDTASMEMDVDEDLTAVGIFL